MAARTRRWHPAHADVWLLPPWLRGIEIAALVLTLVGLVLAASATSSGSSVTPQAAMTLTSQAGPTAPADERLPPSTSAGSDLTSPGSAAADVPTAGSSIPIAPSALVAGGLPATALLAYQNAANIRNTLTPGCGIAWPLLAAIGRVESNHGRFGGSILYANGDSDPHIIGIALNGVGTALIRDTDAGQLDGDPAFDRAVGPMQFIPSTWGRYAQDGNSDGRKDPFNIFDAAAAAADYLCRAGGDLRTAAGQSSAILAYNHSDAYLGSVLATEVAYAAGAGVTIAPVSASAPTPNSSLPPVNPGPPLITTPAGSATPSGPIPPGSTGSTTPTSPAPTCSSTPGGPATGSTPTGSTPTGSTPTSSVPTHTPTTPIPATTSPTAAPSDPRSPC